MRERGPGVAPGGLVACACAPAAWGAQARPGHPYRQFSWGNKKSLWDQPLAAGLDIRQHIQDYYKQVHSHMLALASGAHQRARVLGSRGAQLCDGAGALTCHVVAPSVGRRKHYGAERMNLVVLGGEDLDTLQVGWRACACDGSRGRWSCECIPGWAAGRRGQCLGRWRRRRRAGT